MSTFVYLKHLIKDRHIASITPTSSAGIKRVCRNIDFSKHNVIVEYGPATGVFSHYILKKMTEQSKLILIERNKGFFDILRESLVDERVSIHLDSAENVEEILKSLQIDSADYVISGIPFSFFSNSLRDEIVRKTFNILNKEGKFLAYQTFFQKDSHLFNHLEKYFDHVQDEYCFLNVPPMRIYEATK